MMTRLISIAATMTIALMLVAATATDGLAQGVTLDKRMILTFSGSVQVPGRTLPAGTYVLRLADPNIQKVWMLFDKTDTKVLATFFCVPTERTWEQMLKANNAVVVRLREAPVGTPPAIRSVYYPSLETGSEWIYPVAQARQIAAVTHQPVLATTSDAKTTSVPTLVFVQPDGSTTASATPADAGEGSQGVGTSGTTEPQPVGTTGNSDDDPAPAP